jgi:hypothetical protein
MSDPPYTKTTTYIFEVDGDTWAVLDFNDEWIALEETRKNGQEDTHFFGEARLVEGKWKLDDDARKMLEGYWGESTIEAIEAFFNEHGVPRNFVEILP